MIKVRSFLTSQHSALCYYPYKRGGCNEMRTNSKASKNPRESRK